jgi:hypothetical protein
MNTIVYNYYLKIPPLVESILLHASYLLSDKTIATGSTRQQYNLFLKKGEQFSDKLRMLEHFFKPHEGYDDVKTAIKSYKDFKKFKHPPTKLIVAHKKLQKALEAEYDNQIGVVLKAMDSTRLMQMTELQQYGYLDWFHITSEETDVPGEKQSDPNEMLQLLPGKLSNEDSLLLLPLSLFAENTEFEPLFNYRNELPEALKAFNFLHACFELPNVLLLSFTELHAIKLQLSAASSPFHKAMDRWIQLSVEDKDDTSTNFFEQEVLPAATNFQAAMNENPILNQHRTVGNDKQRIQFALGQINLASVWRAMRDREMIPWDEEWETLQQIADDPAFRRPRPVLVMSSLLQEQPPQIDGNVLLKKSLEID